jgi:hypothetical protein
MCILVIMIGAAVALSRSGIEVLGGLGLVCFGLSAWSSILRNQAAPAPYHVLGTLARVLRRGST